MLSVRAAGSFGNTLTYAENQSGPIGRFRALPADPRNQKQLAYRSAMRMLSLAWQFVTPFLKATWDNEPLALKYSNYHAFCSFNLLRFAQSLPFSKQPTIISAAAGPTFDPPYIEAVDGRAVMTIPNVVKHGAWGIYLWRDTSTSVPYKLAHCIGVYRFEWNGTHRFTDIPPEPDHYYYQLYPFRTRGCWATPLPELDVVV